MGDPHTTKPRINWAPPEGCIPTGYGYAVYSNCIVDAQDQCVWCLRVADTLCMGSEWAFNVGDELLDNFDFRMLESSYFSSLKYEEVQSQDVPGKILRKWLARVKDESEKPFMKEVKEEHINDLLLMAKHEESFIIPHSEVHAVIIAISEGIQSRMENYSLPPRREISTPHSLRNRHGLDHASPEIAHYAVLKTENTSSPPKDKTLRFLP